MFLVQGSRIWKVNKDGVGVLAERKKWWVSIFGYPSFSVSVSDGMALIGRTAFLRSTLEERWFLFACFVWNSMWFLCQQNAPLPGSTCRISLITLGEAHPSQVRKCNQCLHFLDVTDTRRDGLEAHSGRQKNASFSRIYY